MSHHTLERLGSGGNVFCYTEIAQKRSTYIHNMNMIISRLNEKVHPPRSVGIAVQEVHCATWIEYDNISVAKQNISFPQLLVHTVYTLIEFGSPHS